MDLQKKMSVSLYIRNEDAYDVLQKAVQEVFEIDSILKSGDGGIVKYPSAGEIVLGSGNQGLQRTFGIHYIATIILAIGGSRIDAAKRLATHFHEAGFEATAHRLGSTDLSNDGAAFVEIPVLVGIGILVVPTKEDYDEMKKELRRPTAS